MFAEILKQLRKENKITQVDLARDLGFFHTAVVKWERGEREPNIDTLTKIADYFGVSVDYLLGHEVNQDNSIVKRPEYALSEKFASDYKNLLTDKNFLDITKLCSAVTPEMRAVAFGYIVALFQSPGVNTQAILGY